MRKSTMPGQHVGWDVYGNTVVTEYTSSEVTRDDSESTIPVNGRYVKPTGYWAEWWTRIPGNLDWSYRGYTSREPIDAPVYEKTWWGYQTLATFANLINQARVNAGDNKMNLGEALGEVPSTCAMIARNATALADMMSRLKRGDVRGAVRAVGRDPTGRRNSGASAASKYLELQFGWMPLIEEVYNGMEVIHHGVGQPPDNGLVAGIARDSVSNTHDAWMYTYTGGQENVEWTTQSSAHVKFLYAFNHESKLRAFNQLGILNPVSILWNLQPMSFIADWFIPIGGYLDAFSATSGLSLLSGYASSKSEAVYKGTPSPIPPSITKRCTKAPISSAGSAVRFTIGDTPMIPRIRLPSSIGQAQTAVALLLQRSRL